MNAERAGAARANRRTAVKLAVVAAGMFGFAYIVLIPMYNVMCRVAGFNGRTAHASEAALRHGAIDRGRLVTVQLLTSVNGSIPWEFRPLRDQVQVHPGAVTEVRFVARNTADRPQAGRAVMSVSPRKAARYFREAECFCAQAQNLKRGEERELPVRFVLDTSLPESVSTVTLSYTLYSVSQTEAALYHGDPERESGPGKAGAVALRIDRT